MDNEASLDNILNGTSEAQPAAAEPASAEPAAPAAEAAPERPRDEHGRFLPKSETEAAQAADPEGASPAPADGDPALDHPALIGERRRRQAAEEKAARVDTLEAQLADLNRRLSAQPPVVQQPAPKPDQWDDPEGHERWLVDQAGQVAEQRAVQAFQRQHVIMSAEAAKAKYPDYLEKVAVFEQLSEQNPGLSAQMFNHPNPAEFAYETAKQHEEVSRYGSIPAMLEAKKAEWEAEALEKLKASLPSNAPPTLSNERNLGSRSGPAWSGPKPLTELLQ